jgi:hypothetical protein
MALPLEKHVSPSDKATAAQPMVNGFDMRCESDHAAIAKQAASSDHHIAEAISKERNVNGASSASAYGGYGAGTTTRSEAL